jgi:transcriptional regulator with XRE-family HTH domain
MDIQQFGLAVKERRKILRLSQLDLSSANGMSRATISALENGRLPEIGLRKAMAICATLGLEIFVKEANARPTLRDLVAERQ